VVAPSYDITATNTASSPAGRLSNHLPWNHIDAVPQEVSDQILWAAVHGSTRGAPAPGPNASQEEHARAIRVWQALRRHLNIRGWTQFDSDH
jgi:hypothetical protein